MIALHQGNIKDTMYMLCIIIVFKADVAIYKKL